MHARIYDFTLTAGGMQRLPVVGDFFKVLSSTGTINVNVDTGASLDLMPGQGLREFNFNTLTITDKSGAANSGKILVGFSGMIDDRVTGEVSVIDGGRSRTLAGVAFWGKGYAAAVAGQLSFVALCNPVGSGKKLLVEQVMAGLVAGAAGSVSVGFGAAGIGALQRYGTSKISSGSASVGEIRFGSGAASSMVSVMADLYIPNAQYGQNTIRLSEPVVVLPGYSFLAEGMVNAGTGFNVEFFEEPV
ncbi:hypothetical protein AZOA_33010 [Azoarcus sp. Aa7]|nr:hypothetical protein [Azoarcus sp. Aa7]